jgi:hypothetical protein
MTKRVPIWLRLTVAVSVIAGVLFYAERRELAQAPASATIQAITFPLSNLDTTPAANVAISFQIVSIAGALVSTTPQTYFTNSSGQLTNVPLPRGSVVQVSAPIYGLNRIQIAVPSGAGPYELLNLARVTLNPLTSGNPMTTIGDMVEGGTNGVPQRLAAYSGGGTAVLTEQAGQEPAWSTSISSAVNSVTNSDGSVTVTPTTGNPVVSLNPAHINTFSVQQVFSNGIKTALISTGGGPLQVTDPNIVTNAASALSLLDIAGVRGFSIAPVLGLTAPLDTIVIATGTPTGVVQLDAAGNVTATSYAGSGASLTGLTQGQISGLVSALSGKQATGNYITALTGDGTASGPGSAAFTLANVVTAGTNPKVTYNAKGLITGGAALVAGDIPNIAQSQVTGLAAALALLAPLASPALTGSPTAPTQSTGDNSTDIATDQFVKNQGYLTTNAVTSVSNSDGSLTISPTTGVVIGSLNVAHANTWSAVQTFNSADLFASTIQPPSDSTTAIQIQTNGGTSILNVDTTNGRVGIGSGVTAPAGFLDLGSPTITTVPAILSQGTINGASSGTKNGVLLNYTGSGSSGFPIALQVDLQAGATSSYTRAASFANSSAGTGTLSFANMQADIGVIFAAQAAGVDQIGIYSVGEIGTGYNVGIIGRSNTSTGLAAVGVAGYGQDSNGGAFSIGVFAGSGGVSRTSLNANAALVADNGSQGWNIAEFHSNGTKVASITNAGGVLATTFNNLTITSSTGTVTVAAAKTLTFSNTLTFTGTDASSVAFGTGGTVAYTNVATLSSLTSVGALTTGSLGTGFVIGGVTMTLGSDASYDLYYRNSSGVLTRLANGTTGQFLGANTSAAPTWGTPSGSGTVTVVSAGSLTSTALVTGGGSQTIQTPSATATLSSGGNISTPGTVTTPSLILSGTGGNVTISTTGTVTPYTFNFPSAVAATPTTMFLRGDGTWQVPSSSTAAGGSNTQVQYNNSTTLGGISGVTSNGTTMTFASGDLLATLPQLTTGINDANGNPLFRFTATASAVYGFTVTNAALAGNPLLSVTTPTAVSTTTAGTGFNITAAPAVAGTVTSGAAAGGAITLTGGAAARLTSGNANGGAVVVVGGAGIGTGVTGIFDATGVSQVVAPVGTAGVPAYTFSGNLTTGIYGGTAVIALSMSGTEKHAFTSTLAELQTVEPFGGSATANLGASNGTWGDEYVAGANSTHGEYMHIQSATTTVSSATGATISASNLIPAGSIVIGVDSRVTTAFTGGTITAISIGDGTTAAMWSSATGITLGSVTNSTNYISTWTPRLYSAATSVVVTSTGTFGSVGTIRLTVYFISTNGPTS